jgi:hypothetical protein
VQTLICLDKDFLRYVLRILKVAKPIISKGIDAGFVFIYEEAKRRLVSVQAFADYLTVFCSHINTPISDYIT